MLAPIDNMVCQDSSSEDEDLEKFKEAAWTFQTGGTNGTNSSGGKSDEMQSRRVIVSQHEHDGNELQTSPEFREHVAKKLGSMLDRCISEISVETISHTDACESNEEVLEGFRLFTTSIPGQEMDEQPPVRRRPIPSSSDSDSEMEMRLREAAVPVTDFFPPSSLSAGFASALPESSSSLLTIQATCTKKKKKKKKKGETSLEELVAEENSPVPKKKKKEPPSQECLEDVEGKLDTESPSPNAKTKVEATSVEMESLQQKVKRRRKKKPKQEAADE
ncbi:protein CUSTOS isoform X1 [Osmerus eperlanus]|uniref:protein CUSTOS isoform X1 n=1 Tax=Osmerus eperlanus TaxID=29151 RepID=UPI002E15B5A3